MLMNAQAVKESQNKQLEYYTDMPVGEILRRTRVHYGQSLENVESVLRIRAQQLGAIENGKLDELPGRVYAIGFVRAYAEYLGLDGDKMVHLFKIQSVGNKARPELNFPVAASESKLPGIFLLVGSLVAVLLIAVVFSFFGGGHKASSGPEDIPSVSEELKAEIGKPKPASIPSAAPQQQQAQTLAAAVPQNSAPVPSAPVANVSSSPSAPPASRISISVKDNTWVEIRNSSGKAIISQVLNPGESYMVPNEQGLVLATGNIGGLEFIVDGIAIPPLGAKGDVARGVKLDPDAMKPASLRGKKVVSQPNAPAPAWQSSIRSMPGSSLPPQPIPVQSARPKLRPEDEAFKPMQIPGASLGTAR